MSEAGENYHKYKLFALEIFYLQSALMKCVQEENALAETFYKSLFKAHPSTKRLFSNDRSKQLTMFSTLIESAAAELKSPSSLEPLLRAVGEHHRHLKLTKEHMELGRVPFLDAVKRCIGLKDFAAHEEVWGNLYTMLIDLMMGEAEFESQ